MDPAINPYSPGAGTPPPELAGRDDILNSGLIALRRVKAGRHGRPRLFLGLRGVGKTVLLNRLFNEAETLEFLTIKIEAPEDGGFARRIVPELNRLLVRLSRKDAVRQQLKLAAAALQNFAAIFKVSYDGIRFGADPAEGIADTHDYETDLSEVIRTVLLAAKAADEPVGLFIDELQYLERRDLAALVVACHEAAQRELPFVFIGAGLPQLAKLAGDAKSYSERLFEFPEVGSLAPDAARAALVVPAQREGVSFEPEVLDHVLDAAQNYPYFLQEWGAHLWNAAEGPLIAQKDFEAAAPALQSHLDRSFFRIRFERCKPVQQKYLRAMAELGPGPHRTGDIAAVLGVAPAQVSATRAQLISLGMIWSERHGETAFTVPLFDAFMKRQMPQVEQHIPQKRKT
jgi:hypothetical protein